ncbi:MAG: hypothetical protein FWE35_11280 [Streptosporangiales bacterium]|nr:hypothetical protein [Streptosporangiales bacterium]
MDSSGRITRDEAARILGVSPSKVLWLAAQGHLADSRREVTRKSVQAEQKWRATASRGQKARRVTRDTWTVITCPFKLLGFIGGILDAFSPF